MRRVTHRRTGFTFIELVSSLCLISLLMAAILPVFLHARDRARQTNCRSNLQQLGQALHLYAQDYDGRFPPRDQELEPVQAYTKNKDIFRCSSEPEASRRKFQSGEELPIAPGKVFLYSSYRYRGGLTNDSAAETPVAEDWAPWHSGERNMLRLDDSVRGIPEAQAPPIGAGTRPVPLQP